MGGKSRVFPGSAILATIFLMGPLPILLLFALPLAGQTAPPAPAVVESPCAACHDSGEKVSKSGHAAVSCQQCHVKHEEFPHPEGAPNQLLLRSLVSGTGELFLQECRPGSPADPRSLPQQLFLQSRVQPSP